MRIAFEEMRNYDESIRNEKGNSSNYIILAYGVWTTIQPTISESRMLLDIFDLIQRNRQRYDDVMDCDRRVDIWDL